MMKKIVIFDIDDTLVKGQSQKLFLDFLYKNNYISLFYYLKISLWFLVYKLGFITNPRPVMEYAFGFLKNKSQNEINMISDIFFQNILKKRFYSKTIDILNEHRKNGASIILISNAVDVLVKRISDFLGVDTFFCTKLEIFNGKYTSKIDGEIMYASNKLETIRKYIIKNDFSDYDMWFYTDHESDTPLLLEATHPNVVNPTNKLKKIATIKKWPIINE